MLLPAELQSAITLGREFPDLDPQVDALTSSQDALKRDARESARRGHEKAESDARIAADQQRAANKRALAEAEEDAKEVRFEASLPARARARSQR